MSQKCATHLVPVTLDKSIGLHAGRPVIGARLLLGPLGVPLLIPAPQAANNYLPISQLFSLQVVSWRYGTYRIKVRYVPYKKALQRQKKKGLSSLTTGTSVVRGFLNVWERLCLWRSSRDNIQAAGRGNRHNTSTRKRKQICKEQVFREETKMWRVTIRPTWILGRREGRVITGGRDEKGKTENAEVGKATKMKWRRPEKRKISQLPV
jgi:hypothetical protein